MPCPAHTDPFLAMAAAAQYIADGAVDEVELEWWADPPEGATGMEHRMTVTMRAKRHRPPMPATVPLLSQHPAAPDDASSLDGPDAG
jgi:hypothetical protein